MIIIFWILNSILLSPLIFPTVLSIILSLDPVTVLVIIEHILTVENGADNGIFDTVSQVLATFIAIVFTISLFVVQLSSEKYTPNVKKYFKENYWRNRTFGLGLFTILTSVLFLILDINTIFSKVIIFGLLLLNFTFFYLYYNRMVTIINPYEIADLLETEFHNSIRQHELEEAKNIISTISDVIIKAVKENDESLTIKYNFIFSGIYYDLQTQKISKKDKIQIETILFSSVFRALRVAIDNKNSSRKYLIHILFEVIQNEASKKEFVDETEIDLITASIFDFNRYVINNDDFELFKTNLHYFSQALISSPRHIQSEIYVKLMEDVSESLNYNQETNEKIFTEIECFNFLLQFLTVRNFSSSKILISALEIYEKNLVKNLETIANSEEKIEAISKIINSSQEEFRNRVKNDIKSLKEKEKFDFFSNYKQLDLLFISLKLHFVFYQLGAFIIFNGKQERINSAIYLKELWDHTRPDDADGVILNESPVTLNPLWLTYLHFYGGRNLEYWTKTSFGISWDFNDYHGAEDYLNQYYLLAITRCIQKGNSKLDLPLVEELDNLKTKEGYKLNEWYKFTRCFHSESQQLLDHLEKLAANPKRWDFLFDNDAECALSITGSWIQAYTKYCEKLHIEIIKRIEPEPGKIEEYSNVIKVDYRSLQTIDKFVNITEFNKEMHSEKEFIHIEQIGSIRKDVFFKEDYSHPEHVFREFSRRIGIREMRYLVSTLSETEGIEFIYFEDRTPISVFNEIKKQVQILVSRGYNPTTIFIPPSIKTNLALSRLCSHRKMKIDALELSIVSTSNYLPLDEIIILDRSVCEWIYKPTTPEKDRITIQMSLNNDDMSIMNIRVKTTVNYSLNKPDALIKIKFDSKTELSQKTNQ